MPRLKGQLFRPADNLSYCVLVFLKASAALYGLINRLCRIRVRGTYYKLRSIEQRRTSYLNSESFEKEVMEGSQCVLGGNNSRILCFETSTQVKWALLHCVLLPTKSERGSANKLRRCYLVLNSVATFLVELWHDPWSWRVDWKGLHAKNNCNANTFLVS